MISDLILLLPALLGFFVLLWLRGRKPVAQEQEGPPENAIVVDGSNVMHWGEDPSAKVLSRVLRELEQMGYTPIVFFDASVGYKLDDHYYDKSKIAWLIGVPAWHVCVVNKGVVADEAILAFATDHQLRVVTNDKFRDWRVQFSHADKKGILVGGTWREGSVVWRGTL
jgi:hypothetical protein